MSGVVFNVLPSRNSLGQAPHTTAKFLPHDSVLALQCFYHVSRAFEHFLPLNDVEQAMHNSVHFAPNTVFLVLRSVAGSDRGVACFFRSLRGVPPIAGILGPTPNTQSVEELTATPASSTPRASGILLAPPWAKAPTIKSSLEVYL